MIKITVEGPAEVTLLEDQFNIIKTPVSLGETGVFFIRDNLELVAISEGDQIPDESSDEPRQLCLPM